MHRFYVSSPLPESGAVILPREVAHRVSRVLRMRPGERLCLFDGTGREVEGILALDDQAASVTVLITRPAMPVSRRIVLYPALIRPNRFEWLIEKATELGVAAIHPVVTRYCQVRPAEFGGAKRARWERIAVEAAEQCGRRTVPLLGEPVELGGALGNIHGLLALPWEQERGSAPALGAFLRTQPADELALLIGPEGGFSADEVELARGNGATTVSLGPLVLRAETAAIAALAIAVDSFNLPS